MEQWVAEQLVSIVKLTLMLLAAELFEAGSPAASSGSKMVKTKMARESSRHRSGATQAILSAESFASLIEKARLVDFPLASEHPASL